MSEYRILSVSRLTGLPQDTIRKWERRYAAVTPRRDERGIRRYSDADIARLRELRKATDLGYPIGEAVALPPKALTQALTVTPLGRGGLDARSKGARADAVTRAVLRGLERYDGEQIDRLLSAASQLLPPADFVFEVMSPLFHQIGESWRAGDLEIGQEHLFSAVARSVLGNLLRRFAVKSDAPSMLFTTPAGEPHEFGILLAAMLAASEGVRAHYLGPSMPAAAIARAAADIGAHVVVVGAANSRSKARLARSLDALTAALPAGARVWLGGKAAQHPIASKSVSIVPVHTLHEFLELVRALALGRAKPAAEDPKGANDS